MAYHRVHTIKGHRYLYRHESYRVGKQVKKRSTYIGPLSGLALAGRFAVLVANKQARDKAFKSDADIINDQKTFKAAPQKEWNPDIEAAREMGIEKGADGDDSAED
jgi:hypothetical protein